MAAILSRSWWGAALLCVAVLALVGERLRAQGVGLDAEFELGPFAREREVLEAEQRLGVMP